MHIYVIAQKSENALIAPVKIGIAQHVPGRLASLKTGCPFNIGVAGSMRCPSREWGRLVERCFHETQNEHRLHGEWFSLDPGLAVVLLDMAYSICVHEFLSDKVPKDVVMAIARGEADA